MEMLNPQQHPKAIPSLLLLLLKLPFILELPGEKSFFLKSITDPLPVVLSLGAQGETQDCKFVAYPQTL